MESADKSTELFDARYLLQLLCQFDFQVLDDQLKISNFARNCTYLPN